MVIYLAVIKIRCPFRSHQLPNSTRVQLTEHVGTTFQHVGTVFPARALSVGQCRRPRMLAMNLDLEK